MYSDRFYRQTLHQKGLRSFRSVVKETDLLISVDEKSYFPELPAEAEKIILKYRWQLEEYIALDPVFRTTFQPHLLLPEAPPIAKEMARAAAAAGVGPMAAVAGAMAEYVGRELLTQVKEVMIENGGDIFFSLKKPRRAAIFAGKSPFSNRIGIEISPDMTPAGLCTSSGTVGPSFSFGRADAAVVLAPSAALADAAATAIGNVIQSKEDVAEGVEYWQKIPGIKGIVVIKDDQLAAWGDIKLCPLT